MSRHEKLIERLLSRPTDFTFSELTTLLEHFGYVSSSAGATGGSRIAFINDKGIRIRLHKPHPGNIMKLYQIDDVINALREGGNI